MPDRPLVLVGTLPPPPMGQSVAFRTLVDGLRERGRAPAVVDLSDGNLSRRGPAGTAWRLLTLGRALAQAAAHCLRRRGGTMYLQIAQSRSGALRDLAFLRIARMTGRRAVLHLHGGNYAAFYRSLPPRMQARLRQAFARADRILVLADVFRRDFDFLPDRERRVAVVPNGLPFDEDGLCEPAPPPDDSTAGASAAPPPDGSDPDRPVRILFLSNLFESKGYLELLEAVRILVRERGLAVACRFCGAFLTAEDSRRYATPAEAEADFRRRLADENLEAHVRWLGRVEGDAKRAELDAAHVMALPTRYVNEGQPISLIEGMAAGCAVAATRHRAIAEILDDGAAGVLLDDADPVRLADALEGLVRDPARRAVLGGRARARVRSRYTRTAHLDALLTHLLPEA